MSLNYFRIGTARYVKALVLAPDGSIPSSITGNFWLQRDSDGYFFNATTSTWVSGLLNNSVGSYGTYDATTGLYKWAFNPAAFGQYTFGLSLSSPLFYDIVDIEVTQIEVYESEDIS